MTKRGAAAAESRYKKLRVDVDRDLFNQGWIEIDVGDSPPVGTPIEYVDLFAGAGGICCGLRQAGFKKLLSNEIDKDASATLRHNFPDSRHFEGSIEHLDLASELPDIHHRPLPLVIGGPPCQGFSVAGFRRDDDPRNRMVDHFLRVVRELKPWFVVIENVPGILTLAGGKYRQAVIDTLGELGYAASVRILEAAEFGVPQMRARAFFVANRLGLPNPYPKPQLARERFVPIETAIADLADLQADPSTNHEWTRHSAEMELRISEVPPGGSLYSTFRDAWKRQHMGVPSMTIKENHGGTHIHPWKNRVLSAREMARLQSFPDDYFFRGTMKRAMWQIGNAVPPRLAQVLGLALRPSILSALELGG
ncbi:MAG: DNA cytosine methyltransferase [Gemmatimonadales bacterium]|nr:DNA cytosine methyltransferase [Gemmatimonadales bacterium]MDZ4390306.1 DNA cytosine methyltransferase [Gemmatimonadales bacterium]